jgi:hypothetical protein
VKSIISTRGKTMGIINSLNKRDDKKFKKTERDELIIIPTRKLLNWYKFGKKDMIRVD